MFGETLFSMTRCHCCFDKTGLAPNAYALPDQIESLGERSHGLNPTSAIAGCRFGNTLHFSGLQYSRVIKLPN
jgi:hypothetical protein